MIVAMAAQMLHFKTADLAPDMVDRGKLSNTQRGLVDQGCMPGSTHVVCRSKRACHAPRGVLEARFGDTHHAGL
eukprot:126355-Chlamydomonas_euryale.AAC.12